MYIRKNQAGSAPGYTWENDGDVVEVDDEFALSLIAIPNGGFSEAPPPEAAPVVETASEESPEEPPAEAEPPKRRGGRPRLPRDKEGNIIRDTGADDEADDDTE